MGRIYSDITKLVGNTPLVQLTKMNKGLGGHILLKLESFNPFCSVKDRIGLNMIEHAERHGELKPGMVIVEATSGNTGIGLAFVAAVKGYPIILTMPETMTLERRAMLKALGAKLELTPGPEGMPGAMKRANDIAKDMPNAWLARQFDNPSNVEVHVETTGPELWRDTDGKIDCLVSGVGTGGTITGVSKFIKAKNPNFYTVAVEPAESPVLSGGQRGPHKIQGMGAGFVPGNYDAKLVNEVITVKYDDALSTTRRMAREEAVFAGISSGAILWSAMQVAKRPQFAGKTIVSIVADFGERYLSNPLYSELQ